MDRRTIGQILVSVGRITEDDVTVALEYQKENGGYFGEALMACGLVGEEELEWGLASQFDLPYVFPEAESIDPEAVALVSPEWALANLTLPILMTEKSVTVIVESPLKTAAVDELRARVDKPIEVALASGSQIRELIRQVFARGAAAEEERHAPIEFTEALDEVLSVGAPRFGISVRGSRPSVWWDDRGTIRRRPLAGDWRADLEHLLTPPPGRHTAGKLRSDWESDLSRAGIVTPLSIRYLADESGAEYLFKPRPVDSGLEERFPLPAAGILSEIKLLARSGTARFIVTAEPEELGAEILPHLPTLLLDPSWRSVYLHAQDQPAAEEAFSVPLPDDPEGWKDELETLRAFHFDVVTVDLTGGNKQWASDTLDVASVAFLLWDPDEETRSAFEAGIRWSLHIARADGGHLEWQLEPLHG